MDRDRVVSSTMRKGCHLVVFVVLALALAGCREEQTVPASLADGINALRIGRFEQAAKYLNQTVQRNPRSGVAYSHLGVANWRLGRLRDAVAALEKATKLLPADPVPAEFLGRIRMQMEDWPQAEVALEEARRRCPDSARILTSLSVVRLKTGRTAEAEELLRKALDIDPEYPAALYNLGVLNFQWTGRPNEARRCFEAFLPLTEDSVHTANARYALSKLERMSAEPRKAGAARQVQVVIPAPVVNPGVPAVSAPTPPRSSANARASDLARTETRQGLDCYRKNDFTQAEAHLRKAIDADASYDVAHYNLGLVHDARGDAGAAIDSFTAAAHLKPAKTDYSYALARAQWKKGMAAEAAASLEGLLKTEPDSARARFLLGLVYEQGWKRTDLAAKQYRRYLELEPKGPHAAYVTEWLAKTKPR